MSVLMLSSRCSHAAIAKSRRSANPTCPGRIAHISARALPEQGEDISEAMKADLERLRAKSGSGAGSSASGSPGASQQSSRVEEAGPLSGFKDTLDKLLIGDFFLVLFILAWLAAGVAQNALSGGQGSPLLDAWYPLWPLLWQPALGVLMAGALVSGGLGWLREQQEKR